MKRTAEIELEAWKDRADRKPLIVRGARQVGKTYSGGGILTYTPLSLPLYLAGQLDRLLH